MSRANQLAQNFKKTGNTVSINATTTSARVAFTSTDKPTQVAVYNSHTAIIYIEFGGSSVEATTTSLPIPPSGWLIVDARQAGYVAAESASGTGYIYFTPGVGA